MTTIIVDAGLRDKLLASGRVPELRDDAGNLIGQFVAKAELGLVTADDPPDVTDDELDPREREEPRFTADHVLERLRVLRG